MKKKNFVDNQIDHVKKASEKGPDWLYGRYKEKLATSKVNTPVGDKSSKKRTAV